MKQILRQFKYLAMGLVAFTACKEEIDTSARYVFTEYTIASYLESHEQFSEYVRLMKQQPVSDLSETSVFQLMTAYGYYTCFAPTNEAIQLYLDSLVIKGVIPEASWDAFDSDRKRDSIRAIVVMNSILDGTEQERTFATAEFPYNNEEFSLNTMADRKVSVTYDNNDLDALFIDGICPVSRKNRDIVAVNGYIHEIGYVVNPVNETLGSLMHQMAQKPESGYCVMGRLLDACHLTDTLSAVKDDVYERLVKSGAIKEVFDTPASHFRNVKRPDRRKYGFTLFAETDEFWSNTLGKPVADISAEDVKRWVIDQGFYPDAVDNGDYTDENNVLNQFVTYHLLPMRLSPDKLVIHYNEKGFSFKINRGPTIPVWAHYVTMGKRRLLRIWESLESNGVYLNRFPVLDNGRHGTYHEVSCTEENEGMLLDTRTDGEVIKLVNSVIYPIDKPLVYDDHVRRELKRQRLRYDIFDFTEEMMNNDLRNMGYTTSRSFTTDEEYKYFNNLWINSRETYFFMLNGWDQGWPNYQADEVCTEGLYDCTWKLPPVPMSGIYEIRMGVSTESAWRGICQIYFGTKREDLKPMGIPVDMALGGQRRNLDGKIYPSNVGWEPDLEDDEDYNAEVDKKMRNNGFMKGPEYIVEDPGSAITNRMQEKSTRRIIVREYMSADEVYYLRFKTVQDLLSKQLFLDYIEWCPKEVYDNPETPEDVW